MSSSLRKSPLRHLVWILPLLALDFTLFRWLALRSGGCAMLPPAAPLAVSVVEEVVPEEPPPPPPPVWQRMVTPTPQQNLLNPDTPGVLQPTGSGRLISAKFGSTRTVSRKGHLRASFHEGVDIAATERDRKGEALDAIFAVAEGRVAFVNSSGGSSTYGKYVVLEHPDPTLGEIPQRDGTVKIASAYTLYAHMADIRFGIRRGQTVSPGDILGTMGHSSSTRPPIPRSRSHLHWEIGLLLNSRFERKSREEKMIPDFGNYNGQNLFGIDPLDFFAHQSSDPGLTMGSYLAQLPPACEVILRGKTPNFFKRYPALWEGEPHEDGPLLLALSESGIPISGRNANAAEIKKLGNQRQAVFRVFSDVLGRNGRGYLTRSQGRWKFSAKGLRWSEILFY